MRKTIVNLLLSVLLPVSAATAQPVPADSSYRVGKLENGLTYYIRHNAREPGIADFYIAQRVGSVLEEPHQRGLAHFLEHMAFNGTIHFPGNEKGLGIVPWCETVGVKFGTNLNAYTSVDQTVYHASAVPVGREGVVDSMLLILHDWGHGLLLTDKEIDKERGVIREEWRTRRSGMATQRMMEDALTDIYKGSKYADCLPIGSMDIVSHFPYKSLRDYYEKWYRPDLQAVMVVGDVDVDKMEAKIRKLFGSVPMPANPARRIYYPVGDNEDMIVSVQKDSEQPIMLVNLYMKHDATPDTAKGSEAYLRARYVEKLIVYMLNGRLQELQQQAEPPVLSASAKVGDFFVSRTKRAFSLSFGCRQENIERSFDAVIGEAGRAVQNGFTASELVRAKKFLIESAQSRHAERNARRNGFFVKRALQHYLNGEPMVSDEVMLDLCRIFDASVTLDDVNAATRQLITNRNQVVVVYAPDKEGFPLPTKDEVARYVERAENKTRAPYCEKTTAQELMTEESQPGSIVAEREGPYGSRLLQLSNGIEVCVKPTGFAKDQITMRFYGDGGTQRFPDADAPNFPFVGGCITRAGVADFDAMTLRKMLAGKNVRVQPSVGDDTQSISGQSSVNDLRTMMQLVHLYFTRPRKDTVAFNGEMSRMRSFLTNREASPQVSYNDSVLSIVYGDSPRRRPVKRATLDLVNYDRILEIYRECFSDAGRFKMILVGNVCIDSLRPLLCRYVASLPSGRTPLPTAAAGRPVHPSPDVVPGNFTRLFTRKMNTPSALVTIFYTFELPFTPTSDLKLDFLKRVLQTAYTDSVREEKGGTYGVSVSCSLDKDSRPTALLKISFRTDPAKYKSLIPIIYGQIEHVATHGPLASSMEKVRKYLKKAYGQNVIDNGYWDYVIYNRLRYGIDYDTDYERLVDAVTAEDVRQTASHLLKSNRRIEITMLNEP